MWKKLGVISFLLTFLCCSFVFAEGLTEVLVDSAFEIEIFSPISQTYFFGDEEFLTFDLNVSANMPVKSWSFTLQNLRDDILLYDNVPFEPNTTFVASRWENLLTVYAIDMGDNLFSKEVFFRGNTSNSAPIIESIIESMYLCEADRLSYPFDVTDLDRDLLEFGVIPSDPFYLRYSGANNYSSFKYELFSGILRKEDVGEHSIQVFVDDGEYSDSADINLMVIEINNAPVISPIGVQTLWLIGEDTSFYKDVLVFDEEDLLKEFGKLNFSINFSGPFLFDFNNSAIINYTASEEHLGIHNISICVSDLGIPNPHENISLCGEDGSSKTTCSNFSITVTNENRAPYFIGYYPFEESFEVEGESSIYFEANYTDPEGTIPDIYWFVDGRSYQYTYGREGDEFLFAFSCGVSGKHEITASITDGNLSTNQTWFLNVKEKACPIKISDSDRKGSEGGTQSFFCTEKWGCSDWIQCQLLSNVRTNRSFSGLVFDLLEEQCRSLGYTDEICGYQTRSCSDLNSCNSYHNQPSLFQTCYYTENPNCEDKIRNCHEGKCEVLIDCGGPCSPCPTCSDGIKNQGELRVDCGGPCRPCIDVPKTLWVTYVVGASIAITLGLFFSIFLFMKIRKNKKRLQELSQGTEHFYSGKDL